MVLGQEDQARAPAWRRQVTDASIPLPSGTGPEADFDTNLLIGWMERTVAGFGGPLRVQRFAGGQSNPTYRLETPTRDYVLRRKPIGTLVKGAHAIEREARVISALGAEGFPVPEVYALCDDPAIIGSPFYVMELVEGRIFWDCTIPEVAKAERQRYFDSMNDVMARLHNVDHRRAGLDDYGASENYLVRQVGRWSKQYLEDSAAGRDPNMDRLITWLPDNIPHDDNKVTLIHGDYRIDNVVFHPAEPRVIAVLDWELSTLGSPVADFCYHAMMYRMPPRIVAGLAGADVRALGIPSEEDYVRAYCERTGRSSIPSYEFYMAFNFFRLAAIFHGIKGRVIRGTASSAQAQQRAELFPELAELAWRQVTKSRLK
jgi:aminoglycoside phosphotransferase (APT) family kinase protein